MRFSRPRRATRYRLAVLIPFAALLLAALPTPSFSQTPAKLLLQSVCILGTDQEYVAVYNPTASAVDLSNYYLTDALFTNQGYWFVPDATKRNSASSGGGTFNDWHVRFPAGAMIAAGDTVAVSVQGSAAFVRAYARKPHYEVVAPGITDDAEVPTMREAFAGSVPASAGGTTAHGLTNSGESVSLYYWDQQSDLVVDIDYIVWGNDNGSGTPQYRYFNIKTGVTVDGPDADTNVSAYLADTPVATQSFIVPAEATQAHIFGNAFRRESYTEGTQKTTGGNGVGGRDETSENLATTWSISNPAKPPFVKGGGPPPLLLLTARAGGPYSGTVNQTISFNGSASTPATGETITAYSWNFGDSQSGTGATPQHTYTTAGTFTVTLTVTGSGGGTNSATSTATVMTDVPPPPSSASKLLLQSVCILGTDQEYVAIYNPNASTVNLSNYYLTDALFTNQGYWNIPDPTKRNQVSSGGGAFSDWHVRFPDGATIAAGDTIAVSIQGSDAFVRAYTRKPHFEIVAPGLTDDATVPTMREAFAGSVPPLAAGVSAHGLTNSGESVTIYYWDQATDLVTDIDYLVWGSDNGSGTPQYRYFNIKTGVTVDGPDADTNVSAYMADTPVASQNFFPPADGTSAHAFGNALRRESYTEGTQIATGGNGVGGRNETSENLATTWSAGNPAMPPFVKGGTPPPGVLTARAGGPYTGTVNQAITFNGSASTPATGGTITAYSWNFGDSQSGTGVSPQHTYTAAGTFTVTLTVTGSTGGTSSATSTATVTSDMPPPPSSASKLLLQSVCILGTDQEYVAIYNPNASAVNLSNYYLTDALFTNQGYWNVPDPTKRNQASSGGGAFSDWHVRFPDGAQIAAGDTIAVSIQGSDAYVRAYARKPHFEVVAPGLADDATVPTMREAFAGSVPPLASGVSAHGLTNAGESISIYYWDQASDLVTDVDYFVWGSDNASGAPQYRYFNIKTGVTVDGPDAGSTVSAYLADTPVATQNFFPPADGTNGHSFGNAFRRESFTEGTQKTTGGNGVGGRDETSENLATTWSAGNPAKPPFVKGSAPPPPGMLTAFITGAPFRASVGQAVSFNGSQSTPATGGTITSYAWSFGDGGTATSSVTSHAYAAPGTYTVTLTVTGSIGGTNTTTTTATISNPSEGELQLTNRTFIPTIGEVYPITLDVSNGLWQFLRIYDMEGREVRVLLDEQSQGKKSTTWDGRDEELQLVAAGTYIAHLETRDESGHIRSFTGPIVVARRLERN